MIYHSQYYGWSRESVLMNTLKIICPEPQMTAWAVQDAICLDFLCLAAPAFNYNSHGFVIWPGKRQAGGEVYRWLLPGTSDIYRWYEEEVQPFEDLPTIVKQVLYVDGDNEDVRQRWCYTVGIGWHHIHGGDSRFDPNRYELVPVPYPNSAQNM